MDLILQTNALTGSFSKVVIYSESMTILREVAAWCYILKLYSLMSVGTYLLYL